jgi:hypothetical protein
MRQSERNVLTTARRMSAMANGETLSETDAAENARCPNMNKFGCVAP